LRLSATAEVVAKAVQKDFAAIEHGVKARYLKGYSTGGRNFADTYTGIG
jgi:hypothetical protein